MTSTIATVDDQAVDDLRRRLITVTMLGVSEGEEREFCRQLLPLKELCDRGVPVWFAWGFVRAVISPWLDVILSMGTDYDRVLWGELESRIIAYLES